MLFLSVDFRSSLVVRKQQRCISALRRAAGRLCFCRSKPQRRRKKGVINIKGGDRHGAKFTCTVHKGSCGNYHEVKRILGREA